MSAFLGPIHFWMYDKILIKQRLTSKLEESFLQKSEIQEYDGIFTKVLDDDLEKIIDKDNIHAWLSSSVSKVEIRFAYVVKKILQKGISIEKIKSVAFSYGESFNKYENIQTLRDAYNLLMDILLDGLPCDVSISIVEENEDYLEFVLHNDIHKEFFKEVGLENKIYHEIRQAFANGVLKKYSFEYKNLENNKKMIKRI
ncbi:hypothetical protein HMPREF3188_01228 [Tissierellia bacterium KA00581]|jgi:hypothetical protein|nr:hypothetical protein HMPREF3188_01228 [Tissierellia bacterium KA00581]